MYRIGEKGPLIELRENQLDVDTYLELRKSVNWKKITKCQAEKALSASLFTVCAYEDGKPIGMGRVVGDGVIIDYIQDLVVSPDFQLGGVGGRILESLITFVKDSKMEGTEMMLCLMCAKGREEFYKKFDFIPRPTDALGPGMIQYL